MKKIVFLLCCMLWIGEVYAHVKPNSLFTDHTVLQQGVPVTIWGTADEQEHITVKFNDQTVSTIAQNGKWSVQLAPMKYKKEPSSMYIMGNDTLEICDVLVGEVWLCSGQSNMERQLGPRGGQPLLHRWEEERDAANYPQIREFYVPELFATNKQDDVHGAWRVCSPATVSDFSAIGYFFAKNLHIQRDVPIGILFSAYGGTIAEDWMSQESFDDPTLAHFMTNYDSITNLEWHHAEEVKNGLYNGMIYPLIPFAMKGVVWYQGENNNSRAEQYCHVLTRLIRNWRTDFGQGNFPFLMVQIAPHKDMRPELREAQLQVFKNVANTALVVITDYGVANEIHPPIKQPVGERLACAAQALAYHEKVVYSGPVYQSYRIKGNQITLRFSHVGHGLEAKNGALKGFVIAGKDGKFVEAQAQIKGNRVIVTSDKIACPTAVRYGWENVPDVNLYNKDGFPASPFRTDVH